MKCEEVDLLIHGYFDEELDVTTSMEVGEHITGCNRCGNNLMIFRSQRATLQSEELYYHPSEYLRNKISSIVRSEARPWYSAIGSRRGAAALSLSLAVLLLVVWRLGMFSKAPSAHDQMIQSEILDSHVRALLSDHLVDVPSSDQHTVKPWFNNKIDYSPNVKNLDADGFTLVGGRLEYIDNKPVSVIVYRRAKHVIDLYSWPATEGRETLSALTTIQGYHLLMWSSPNTTYCAVSDVEENQLEQFRELTVK